MRTPSKFIYSPWRHGGWYVDNVRYPSGAVGCISNNYADKKWRIACDPRPFEKQPTFPNRDAAAQAELDMIRYGERVAAKLFPDAVYTGDNPYNSPEGRAWGEIAGKVLQALGSAHWED